MAAERLEKLLDLSIPYTSEGIITVNYAAMRKLLHRMVQSLGTDIETADGGKAHDESLLDEKGAEISEQESTEVGEVSSGTELSLSDTAGVPKLMNLVQASLNKNHEVENETNNQKQELDSLQSPLSQSTSLMHDLLNLNQELMEEIDKLKKDMETLKNQLNQNTSLMEDLQKENQELKEETDDLKQNVDTLQSQSSMEDLLNENQELKEETNELRKEMDELKNQFSQVCEMGVLGSGLGGELDMSDMIASDDTDGITGSEQQHRTQVARNPVQQLFKEVQNIKQELHAFRMEQKGTSEKEIQDKFTQVTNDVQMTILHLQSELEKVQNTTMKNVMQEQILIENLNNSIKELEEKINKKADMHALETTVAATTQQLNEMIQELHKRTNESDENHNMFTEKIFRELKVIQAEVDRLQKQVEFLQKAQCTEMDNAAIVKTRLMTKFHCLSCDRPVNMKTPGPNLSQSMRSSTERSIKQTRNSETCVSDGLINNGYYDYHVNHSQLSESICKNFRQESPSGQQLSETDMICIGTSCFKKERQWSPEDSLSLTQQSQQQVFSVLSDKE